MFKTPHLDALAARGVRFSQAVCNVPMCVPSRYSMMTGLYGFQCGVKHNTQMLTRDEDLPVPVLAQRLAAAGYQTAGIGKTHWYIGSRNMPGVPIEGSCRGFEVRALRGTREPSNDECGALYMADDEPEQHAQVAELQKHGGPGGESIEGYTGGVSGLDASHHAEGWLTRQALNLFASDHGDMMGERGRVSKYCLYESSVRVPLILAGPGVARAGEVDDRPAELVDVLPTLLAAADEEIPEALPGMNLLSSYARSGTFAEMHGGGYENHQQAPAVMWRTAEWKLILFLPGPLGDLQGCYENIQGELYHWATDPLELNNRYADPACAAIRERMTAQVLMHIMSSLGRFPGGPSRARISVADSDRPLLA